MLTYSNRRMTELHSNTIHPVIRKSPAGFRTRTLLVTAVMNMLIYLPGRWNSTCLPFDSASDGIRPYFCGWYVAIAGTHVTCSILAQLRVHALLHKEIIPYYKYVHTAFLNVTQCSSHVKTSDQQFQKGANIRACGVRERACNNVFKVNQHQACFCYITLSCRHFI
jgi:hypothetical protein